MMNLSKTTLLTILLIIFVIFAGFFAYQWWRAKGELEKKMIENQNLREEISKLKLEIGELQKEIEELKALQKGVSLKIDKTEYKKGETIKIEIENNLDKSIWYLDEELCGQNPWWRLQRFGKNIWEELKLHKPIEGECIICVREYIPLEELIKELKSNSKIADEWDFKNCEITSPVGPQIELKAIEPGIYRISFSYGLTKNSYTEKTIYSNEFIIK